MKNKKEKYIDREEKKIIESLGEYSVDELKKEHDEVNSAKLKEAAVSYLGNQNVKMNLRVDPKMLEKLKEEAAKSGLKYQTFVKSILHKYLTGQLKEI